MNTVGIIIEGVCGSGKTSFLRHFRQSLEFLSSPWLSQICLTEHHTQRVLEPIEKCGNLRKEDHLNLMTAILGFIRELEKRAAIHDWHQRKKNAHRISFILERFHLTHVTNYPYLCWDDISTIDRSVAELNATLILLTADADTLSKRLYDPQRDPGWFEYLSTIAQTKDGVVLHYLAQQQQLIKLSEQTAMPVIQIDTSRESPRQIVNHVLSQLKMN